jgi:hypothetical protein
MPEEQNGWHKLPLKPTSSGTLGRAIVTNRGDYAYNSVNEKIALTSKNRRLSRRLARSSEVFSGLLLAEHDLVHFNFNSHHHNVETEGLQ